MPRSPYARSKKRSLKRKKISRNSRRTNKRSNSKSARLSNNKINATKKTYRRRSKHGRRQNGGFLGLGSLKQGISNLYRKVIGNKEELDRDRAEAPFPVAVDDFSSMQTSDSSVRQYPLQNDAPMNSDFGNPLAQNVKSPYTLQTGQGHYYY